MINIFRLPSEPSSLDLYHALTPIVLGCSSAYEMHVCQFQYTRIIKITQSCYVIIISNTKISSLGLMFKHKKFDSNYLTKHIISRKYIFVSLFLETVKP